MITVIEVKTVPGCERNQRYVVREPFAKQAEQFFKKKGGCDDRGTGVMPEATAFKHLCPTAKRLTAVNECDVVTFGF